MEKTQDNRCKLKGWGGSTACLGYMLAPPLAETCFTLMHEIWDLFGDVLWGMVVEILYVVEIFCMMIFWCGLLKA